MAHDRPDLIKTPVQLAEQMLKQFRENLPVLTGNAGDPLREQLKEAGYRVTQLGNTRRN